MPTPGQTEAERVNEDRDSSRAAARPLMPAAETASCNCFSQINEHLKTYGGELLCNLFGPPRAIVSTYREKAVRGKKMPIVFATFCPFCGVKYPEEKQ